MSSADPIGCRLFRRNRHLTSRSLLHRKHGLGSEAVRLLRLGRCRRPVGKPQQPSRRSARPIAQEAESRSTGQRQGPKGIMGAFQKASGRDDRLSWADRHRRRCWHRLVSPCPALRKHRRCLHRRPAGAGQPASHRQHRQRQCHRQPDREDGRSARDDRPAQLSGRGRSGRRRTSGRTRRPPKISTRRSRRRRPRSSRRASR